MIRGPRMESHEDSLHIQITNQYQSREYMDGFG